MNFGSEYMPLDALPQSSVAHVVSVCVCVFEPSTNGKPKKENQEEEEEEEGRDTKEYDWHENIWH